MFHRSTQPTENHTFIIKLALPNYSLNAPTGSGENWKWSLEGRTANVS